MAAFSGIIAVFLVASELVMSSVWAIQATGKANDHTREVLSKITSLSEDFSAQQNGHRGFLIATEEASLGSYHSAVEEFDDPADDAR
jgi:CHASE3 domain sensor protein